MTLFTWVCTSVLCSGFKGLFGDFACAASLLFSAKFANFFAKFSRGLQILHNLACFANLLSQIFRVVLQVLQNLRFLRVFAILHFSRVPNLSKNSR